MSYEEAMSYDDDQHIYYIELNFGGGALIFGVSPVFYLITDIFISNMLIT